MYNFLVFTPCPFLAEGMHNSWTLLQVKSFFFFYPQNLSISCHLHTPSQSLQMWRWPKRNQLAESVSTTAGVQRSTHAYSHKKNAALSFGFSAPVSPTAKKGGPIQPCLHSDRSFTSLNTPHRSCLERGENALESNCPALWRRLVSARQRTFPCSLGGKVRRILLSRMGHLSVKRFPHSRFLARYEHGSDVAALKWMLSATELRNLTWAFPMAVSIFLHGGHSSADGERNSTAVATFSDGQTVLQQYPHSGKLMQMASALANHPAHRIPRVATLWWDAPRQILWWRAHSGKLSERKPTAANSLWESPQQQILWEKAHSGKFSERNTTAANSLRENPQRQTLWQKTRSGKFSDRKPTAAKRPQCWNSLKVRPTVEKRSSHPKEA